MKVQMIVTYNPHWPMNGDVARRNEYFHTEQREWRNGTITLNDVIKFGAGNIVFRVVDDSAADLQDLQEQTLAAARAHKWAEVAQLCRQIDVLIDDPDLLQFFYGEVEAAAVKG